MLSGFLNQDPVVVIMGDDYHVRHLGQCKYLGDSDIHLSLCQAIFRSDKVLVVTELFVAQPVILYLPQHKNIIWMKHPLGLFWPRECP